MPTKITGICPFCGSYVERLFEQTNGFCKCGAKYYFMDKLWLNRKTGETIKEEVINNGSRT